MTKHTFKKFFAKTDIDYENPNLDLFKLHPQLRIFLVLNGIFFNNTGSYIRFIWPMLSNIMTMIAASLEIMFIYHGVTVKDYSFATECFCYFVIITTVPIVYTSVLLNSKKLMDLIYSMNRDFLYICSLDLKYRTTFIKGQVLIWQLCVSWFSFITMIEIMYLGTTLGILLYQSLFATQTEHMVRPMMFPLWLPADDPYRTPNYEIFFVIEAIVMFTVQMTFCVYIYVLFHVLLHYYFLMSMIIFDCEVLFDGLDESVGKLSKCDPRRVEVQSILNSRMRRIVEWHNLVFQSIKAVSSIYGPPLVYQVLFSSLPICLTAYQVAEAYCAQAFAVGDAMWGSGWHETPLGRLVRADVTLVIMRSQRPLSIKFTGLPNLDLETFSSIMSSAYSYFTLLRRYSQENN